MRIHTDTLTRANIVAATPPEIHIDSLSEHGSRSRDHAFDVKLASYYGGKGTTRPHHPNSGTIGHDGSQVWAATYDEWGYFLAALYRIDPAMIAEPYKSAADFHDRTNGSYR